MAATVEIHEMTATQTGFDRTGQQVRFYSSDKTATNDTTNPITIPGAASDHSFTKQLRFYIGATGPSGFIASLEWYSDGNLWNNAASKVLVQYDRADRTTWGANVDTDISGTDIANATLVSAATMAVPASQFTTTTTYHGGMLRLQMEVGAPASPGTLGNETITFTYNEQ